MKIKDLKSGDMVLVSCPTGLTVMEVNKDYGDYFTMDSPTDFGLFELKKDSSEVKKDNYPHGSEHIGYVLFKLSGDKLES